MKSVSSPAVTNSKKVVVKALGNEYDFNLIKARTKHAPVIEVTLNDLLHNNISGHSLIDASHLILHKVDGKYLVLSGYNKIKEVMTDSEDTTLVKLQAKLMSKKYLDSTLIERSQQPSFVHIDEVPFIKKQKETSVKTSATKESVSSLAEKFEKAGFNVRKSGQ